MTFEAEPNIPAQLIINGETIDVTLQAISTREEFTTRLLDIHIQTVTTFECIKIENKLISRFRRGVT